MMKIIVYTLIWSSLIVLYLSIGMVISELFNLRGFGGRLICTILWPLVFIIGLMIYIYDKSSQRKDSKHQNDTSME